MKIAPLCAGTACWLVLTVSGAAAQVVDYGTLQDMFGELVTTSATGKPQRVSDAPVNMEIITATDIKKYPARSIPEILKYTVGLDVWENGNRNFDVGVLGQNQYLNPRVLVMINGRQVYLDHYGFTNWALLPVSLPEIRQIEVVKGPNTALFGFNAAAGVINIITWNPQFDDKSGVDVNVGTGSDIQNSVYQTIKIGDQSGLRLGAGHMRSQAFDNYDVRSGNADQKDPRGRDLHLDARFQVADRTVLSMNASHNIADMGEAASIAVFAVDNHEMNSVGLGVNHETDSWGAWDLNIYQNDIGTSSTALPGLVFNNKVTVAKLQNLFKVGSNHSFRVAGEYRHNEDSVAYNANANIGYDVLSFSTMWDWTLSDQLTWTNAARVDRLKLDRNGPFNAKNPFDEADYNRDFSAYSANSGLVWKPTELDSFNLSYGRGLQMPSLLNLGAYEAPLGPLLFTGNPNLNPTVLTSVELNYTRHVPTYNWKDHVIDSRLRAALYHNHLTDLSDLATYITNPPLSIVSEHVGSSTATGFGVSYRGTVDDNWRFNVNYNIEMVDDDLTFRNTGAATSITDLQGGTARHVANISLGRSWGEKWDTDAYLHYVSGRVMAYDTTAATAFDTSTVKVDAVYSLGVKAAYHVTDDLTVSLNGTNLQAARSEQTSMPDVDRRLWMNLSYGF